MDWESIRAPKGVCETPGFFKHAKRHKEERETLEEKRVRDFLIPIAAGFNKTNYCFWFKTGGKLKIFMFVLNLSLIYFLFFESLYYKMWTIMNCVSMASLSYRVFLTSNQDILSFYLKYYIKSWNLLQKYVSKFDISWRFNSIKNETDKNFNKLYLPDFQT